MAKKDTVIVSGYAENYMNRLAWFCADDEEEGATLGDGAVLLTPEQLLALEDDDEWEFRAAESIASQSKGVSRDYRGFFWESSSDMMAALRSIKMQLKTGRKKPMPDWALKASAAGWKPPKGWKP